jgi:hypothetical protein
VTISNLGSIGEAVGALAVLISLVYLAIQIRQNTQAMRASTFLGLTNAWQDYLLQSSHPEFSELLEKAARDPQGLADDEVWRLYSLARVVFRRFENDFFQFESGTFDQGAWDGYRASLHGDILAHEAFRAMWRLQHRFFAPNFVGFIDEELQQLGARKGRRASLTELWRAAIEQESPSPGAPPGA